MTEQNDDLARVHQGFIDALVWASPVLVFIVVLYKSMVVAID